MEEGTRGDEGAVRLEVRWHGRSLTVDARADGSVLALKRRLEDLTGVPPHAQKLIGLLPRGRHAPDHASLGELGVPNGQRVMLVGIEAARAAQLASEEEQHRALVRAHEEAEQARMKADRERQLQEELEEERRRAADAQRLQERAHMHRAVTSEERVVTQEEGHLEIELSAYSSAVADNPRLDMGDKVVLPPYVLEQAVRLGLAFPLTFKMSKRGEESPDHVTHCGALAFDAPTGMCYLPAPIMKKIGVQEGEPIVLSSVKLPKGEYIQLQPQSALWVDIPLNVREAILADQLRNYQTLTVGDTVTLAYGGTKYTFFVMAVKPSATTERSSEESNRGVSIVDADVAVDVVEPREPYRPIMPIELDASTPTVGVLALNDSTTYRLRIDESLHDGLTIGVDVLGSGDVDLYISNTSENKRPTQLAHTWRAQNTGAKRLHIHATDPKLKKGLDEGYLYISVYAYEAPPDAPVRFSLECTRGYGLGQQLGHESSREGGDVTLCPNCRREIPTSSYPLHEVACLRRNWRCEECGAVMPVSDRDKHRALAHVQVACECGMRLPPSEMQAHKEDACPRRLVSCLYCDLLIPFDQRGEHQGACGNRTVTCALCGSIHKRNAIEKHVVEQHGIYPHHFCSDHYYTA